MLGPEAVEELLLLLRLLLKLLPAADDLGPGLAGSDGAGVAIPIGVESVYVNDSDNRFYHAHRSMQCQRLPEW